MSSIKKYIFITLCFVFLCGCRDIETIENLSIITGFGFDIERGKDDEVTLISAIEFVSIQNKDGSNTAFFEGKGNSIYSSIEDYKSKQGKPFRYGSELVYIISEERAKLGIEDAVFDLVSYPDVNVNAKVVVCKGKCKDYFSIEQDAGSGSIQLSNIVKFENQEFYYSKDYTVSDFLCMYYQQGRHVYLPYVELVKENPQLAGVAIFKDNKLLRTLPIEEANYINLLRSSKGKGIISIASDNTLEYLEMEGENKTKVNVSKENDKLKYDISVKITGDLRIDTLYRKEFTKEQIAEFEEIFAQQLKKDLDEQVNKVQEEYKFDCFDFSKYALAKFGKESGYDSEEYFSNSDINVEVKVKINTTGRIQDSSHTK